MSDSPRPSLARRMVLGLSGQLFARVVAAVYGVALVPVLISNWGLGGYGQWIALTALTAYLGYSNFGLVTTASNEMVMAAGAQDPERARRAYQMSVNLTAFVVLPLVALVAGSLALLPIGRLLNLTQIDVQAVRWVVGLSAFTLWVQTLRGLQVAVLFAAGSYGFAYHVQAIVKLCELVLVAALVGLLHGTQAAAASIISLLALLEFAVLFYCARRAVAWARIDLTRFELPWMREQARPALGYLVASLSSQGLMNQGPRVALGALLGGEAVGIYAVCSSAVRLVDQLLLTVIVPLEVEIAHASGRGELPMIRRILVLGTQLSGVLFCLVGAVLMVFGPFIFHVWTRGRVPFAYGLMGAFLGMSAANLLGRVSYHALVSTNQVHRSSLRLLVVSVTSLALGALLTPWLGVTGMVLGGAAGESVNSLVSITAVSRWLGTTMPGLLAQFASLRGGAEALRTLVPRWRPT